MIDLDIFINNQIQGVFGGVEIALFEEEISKLNPGQVYLEVGVDEGRSMTAAHLIAKEGVYVIGVDINDVQKHEKSLGRGPWAQKIGMIGIGRPGFFVHGDADLFARLFKKPFIDVCFIDGHHDYESVKNNTLKWEPLVKKGGVILFHDYDHPETKKWLDEYYGNKKEVFGGKIVRVKVGD